MLQQQFYTLVLILLYVRVDFGHCEKCEYCTTRVDVGSPAEDCVRFRSVSLRRLVFGTGYFHNQDYYRFLGVWKEHGTAHYSALKLEKIREFTEPLYYIKMINPREYVFGGTMNTATHEDRVPVFSYHHSPNTTRKDDGVWGFEKSKHRTGAWYIKNVYYNQYLIASEKKSEPPAGSTSFWAIKLDRRYQEILTDDHEFYIEGC